MHKERERTATAAANARSLVDMLRASNRKAEVTAKITMSEEQYRALEAELARKLRKRAA